MKKHLVHNQNKANFAHLNLLFFLRLDEDGALLLQLVDRVGQVLAKLLVLRGLDLEQVLKFKKNPLIKHFEFNHERRQSALPSFLRIFLDQNWLIESREPIREHSEKKLRPPPCKVKKHEILNKAPYYLCF